MKKRFLLLAGSALLLSSCGSNTKQPNVQVIIDSAVNANVAKHDAENAVKNDSIINAEAKIKAEAMQGNQEHVNKKEDENKPATAPSTTPTTGNKPNPGTH